MISNEGAVSKFVMQYDIEVPEELVEQELSLLCLDMMHKIQYARLSGELSPFDVPDDMEEREEELKQLAYETIKKELVVKDVIKKQGFVVTKDELEKEATEMAKRQDTTVELIKKFFGEDLSMLEGDVLEKKATEWMIEQIIANE